MRWQTLVGAILGAAAGFLLVEAASADCTAVFGDSCLVPFHSHQGLGSTNVHEAIDEVKSDLDSHTGDTDAHRPTYVGTDPTSQEPCSDGETFQDTDATTGQQWLACESGVFVQQCGSSQAAVSNPVADTLDGNMATNATIRAIEGMGSFTNLPIFPKVYVSADTSPGCPGDLKQGNDSWIGSRSRPIRSMEQVEKILALGIDIEIVFDACDTWDQPADWFLTENSIRLLVFGGTNSAILSGSDYTGQRVPLFDCRGLDPTVNSGHISDSLVVLDGGNDTSRKAYVQNLHFEQCPAVGTEADNAQDVFRYAVNGSGGTFLLNVTVNGLVGLNNQRTTAHGSGNFLFMDFNPSSVIYDNTVVNTHQIVNWASATDDTSWVHIINPQFATEYNPTSGSTAQHLIQVTSLREIVVLGGMLDSSSVTNDNSTAFGISGAGISAANGGTDALFALVRLTGLSAGVDGRAFGFNTALSNVHIRARYHKVSVSNSDHVWASNNLQATSTHTDTFSCVVAKGITNRIFDDSIATAGDCVGSNYLFLNDNIVDDGEFANSFRHESQNYANIAAWGTGSVTQGCNGGAGFDVSGLADTNQQEFGSIQQHALCSSGGDCFAACDSASNPVIYNFQPGAYWPAELWGVEVQGYKDDTVSNVGAN